MSLELSQTHRGTSGLPFSAPAFHDTVWFNSCQSYTVLTVLGPSMELDTPEAGT